MAINPVSTGILNQLNDIHKNPPTPKKVTPGEKMKLIGMAGRLPEYMVRLLHPWKGIVLQVPPSISGFEKRIVGQLPGKPDA